MEVLVATDFFTAESGRWEAGDVFRVFFLHLGSRRSIRLASRHTK